MKWIRQHKFISAIIAVLIIAFIVLGVTAKTGGVSGTGIINRVLMTIEKPISSFGSSIKKNVSGVFSYRELVEEIEELKAENEKLKNEVSQLTFSAKELQQLQDLSKALNYDFIQGETDLVTAKVVSLDGTNWTNSFTIDKGTESGIKALACSESVIYRIGIRSRFIQLHATPDQRVALVDLILLLV